MIAMVKTGGQEEVELLQGERTTSGPDSRFVLSGGKSELRGARSKTSPVFFCHGDLLISVLGINSDGYLL